jgi:hypothetical protein
LRSLSPLLEETDLRPLIKACDHLQRAQQTNPWNKYLKDKFIAQMILKIASSITKSCLFLRCKTYILRESSHEQEI